MNKIDYGINGGDAQPKITTHGSDVYWAVCAVMTVATIAFIGLSTRKDPRHRIFHYITAAITMVAAIAYFTMASDLGRTPIYVEFYRSNPKVNGYAREIFYVRYIDWVITTPLLLLDLLLTAALPWPTILFVLLVDEVMIVCGLVGALTASSYKWAYFTFGMVALFYILWVLLFEARKHSLRMDRFQPGAGKLVSKAYVRCGVLTAFLWLLYPIAWGLSEGGNVIAPDSEAVFYGILDVLAKVGFGILLILSHKNIDPTYLGLRIRTYDENDHAGFAEKQTLLSPNTPLNSSTVGPTTTTTTLNNNMTSAIHPTTNTTTTTSTGLHTGLNTNTQHTGLNTNNTLPTSVLPSVAVGAVALDQHNKHIHHHGLGGPEHHHHGLPGSEHHHHGHHDGPVSSMPAPVPATTTI